MTVFDVCRLLSSYFFHLIHILDKVALALLGYTSPLLWLFHLHPYQRGKTLRGIQRSAENQEWKIFLQYEWKNPQPRAVFATIGREQILKIDFGNILPDFPDAKEISTETKILVHFVSKHYWLLAEKYLFLIIWGNAWCPIWTLIYPSFLKHGLCFLL